MILFPAIDLLDGACVRLRAGAYDSADKVAESALETAKEFVRAGATHLHTVDLDGAKNGAAQDKNRRTVYEIAQTLPLSVELGGGIRTLADIEAVAAGGVERIILGSAATDLDLLDAAVARYGDRIVVGIDAKNGLVAVSGWTKQTGLPYLEFARTVAQHGVSTIICTDISRDGMLSGPNFEMLAELQRSVDVRLVASGGVRNLDDVKRLRDMGLYGAICGKSLYAGTLDLAEAIEVCQC